MYFLIAKRIEGCWSVYGTYSNRTNAEEAKGKFEQSMYLLELIQCQVIHESQVINTENIGWENRVCFKSI